MGQKVTPVRVVIDTNILVSGLLFGGKPGKLRDLWIAGRLLPLLSKETFTEFRRVLNYPKFRLSPAEIIMLVEEELLPYADVLDVTVDASGACRDPNDDKFLALAASGKAAYLITGDQDLLVLQSFKKTKIVTVNDIAEIMLGNAV
ncbi:MAG: putative toxin-antitoxin system toxin component, PIN family [Geobacteraceae bacterium GWC2_58_44]|nr:MAG: putative toxin-antitoxin system toxin component, PIN family [Geobacteraceae bacterium GWC2_58_44]HBG05602.1 putative toxin-antitoxin system toxin component, PIN family [Geobacter sp.]